MFSKRTLKKVLPEPVANKLIALAKRIYPGRTALRYSRYYHRYRLNPHMVFYEAHGGAGMVWQIVTPGSRRSLITLLPGFSIAFWLVIYYHTQSKDPVVERYGALLLCLMATALALDAVMNGATQIECTINGLGERAGNTSLEEVVMAIKMHGEALDAHTDVVTQELTRASKLVSSITGINVQPNKAIVGANAFAHSSGIHQDGVLKARDTYEIIDPADVGAAGSEIILSARSGHAALRHRLGELGYTFADEDFDDVYSRFLEIADQKKEVFDEDLEAMVQERQRDVKAVYTLDALQVSCGDPLVPTATATITDEVGATHVVCATGSGPVDAAYKAIDKVVAVHGDLSEFNVKAITRGIDAIGEVTVRITADDGKIYTGRGADNDIIVSSAKAYVNAVNRMIQTTRSKEGK